MRRACLVVAVAVAACKGGDTGMEPRTRTQSKAAAAKPEASAGDAQAPLLEHAALFDGSEMPFIVASIVWVDAKGAYVIGKPKPDGWIHLPSIRTPVRSLDELRLQHRGNAGGHPAMEDPPMPREDEGEDEDGTGSAMALEEGKMGKVDSERAEGSYKMGRRRIDPPPAPKARASLGHHGELGLHHIIGARAVPVGDLQDEPVVLANPAAPGPAVAPLLVALGGAIAVTGDDGKLGVLKVGFTARRARPGRGDWVEIVVTDNGVRVVEAEGDQVQTVSHARGGRVDRTGLESALSRLPRAIARDTEVDVLLAEGSTAQHLVDVLATLHRTPTRSIGVGEPADRAPPRLPD
ncbi:MAG: hypothetical protein KF773_21630 [Deltaproteobacteria bacterium]|nr:hypothetical protein [Deltaproteobacteria bacterium]